MNKSNLALIALIILAIITVYFFSQKLTPIKKTAETGGTTLAEPSDELKSFVSDDFEFSFGYPKEYALKKSELIVRDDVKDGRDRELELVLESKEAGAPQIRVLVNKEIDSARPDRIITLFQIGNGLLVADKFDDVPTNEERSTTIGSLVMSDNNVYTFELKQDRETVDYYPHLKQIISSFSLAK